MYYLHGPSLILIQPYILESLKDGIGERIFHKKVLGVQSFVNKVGVTTYRYCKSLYLIIYNFLCVDSIAYPTWHRTGNVIQFLPSNGRIPAAAISQHHLA